MAATGSESAPQRAARSAAVLAAVAVVGFGLVALMHDVTRDEIAAVKHERQLARFRAVLGDTRFDNDLLADHVDVRDPELLGTAASVRAYRARWQGEAVAVVLEPVAPNGYAGPIGLLVGIARDGTVLGVRVGQHRETPGLGDAIDERKSTWIERFAGTALGRPPLERWKVRKDGGEFDQFTGATITPRAVVGAISNVLVYFERHRDELLAPTVTIASP